ncbi:MAG: hypothetical protein MJ193_04935, partial [Clostridia bacterium]|nr:hypothetical protein [Clostridia bacterium]
AYLVFVYFFNTMDVSSAGSILSDTTLSVFSTLTNVVYPNKVLIYYCLGIDAGINFGISAACTVGMIVIMLSLSLLFYKRITIRRVEGKSTTVNRTVEYKQEGVVWSLVKRDFYSIIRNPALALSSIANTLLAPIFIVLMYFITGQKQAGDDALGALSLEMMSIGYIVMYSSIFLCGTNMLAMMAYTREGKTFYLAKSLPITAKDSIMSKLVFSCIVPEIMLILILFIAIFLYKVTIISTLLTFLAMSIMLVGLNSINIYEDMKHGNVNWTTSDEMKRAAKANTGSIGAVFMAIIPGAIYMFIGIFLAETAPELGRLNIMLIFWGVVFVISLAIFAIGIYILKNKCEPLYDKIGENKIKIKNSRSAFGNNNTGSFLN